MKSKNSDTSGEVRIVRPPARFRFTMLQSSTNKWNCVYRQNRIGLLFLSVSLFILGAACSNVNSSTGQQQQNVPKPYSSPSVIQAIQISPSQAQASESPAASPATFKIDKLSIEPDQISAGDKVTITAFVSNVGGAQGIYNSELKIDGIVEIASQITLGTGESKSLSFYTFRDLPGMYDVVFGDRAARFTVMKPPQADQSPASASALVATAASADSSLPACHLAGGQNGGTASGSGAGSCCSPGVSTAPAVSQNQNPITPVRSATSGCYTAQQDSKYFLK